ncbi:MAG: ribosome recycling factor [Patescibacteria group bacterium]
MEEIIKDLEQKTKTIFDALRQEIVSIRTNRPTAKLVEDIKADYFGQQMSIKQLASISIVPPREIDISVWDKNALAPIVKAIESSNLGVTANTDGNLIRINLPPLTDERRKELIKLIKGIVEQSRIKIRAMRDEANKKTKDAPEDQKFKLKEKIQDIVDKTNKEIEALLAAKIKEIEE